MKIRALIPFTLRDADSGELVSIACGAIATVDDEVGAGLITDGLAEAYTLVEPTGSETITANGSYDISTKASVVVNVGTLTVTYDVNGGTGSVSPETVIAGNAVTLDDGTGITPPSSKVFAGWATTNDATVPDVESPYTPTASITIYAVWVDE